MDGEVRPDQETAQQDNEADYSYYNVELYIAELFVHFEGDEIFDFVKEILFIALYDFSGLGVKLDEHLFFIVVFCVMLGQVTEMIKNDFIFDWQVSLNILDFVPIEQMRTFCCTILMRTLLFQLLDHLTKIPSQKFIIK